MLQACSLEAIEAPDASVDVTKQALGPSPDTSCQFFSSAGRDYWFCAPLRSWQTARTKCQAIGLDLVTIGSSPENQFVSTHLLISSWIGANDVAAEGQWRWAQSNTQFWQGAWNGSAVGGAYKSWSLLQPDNLLNQDCGTTSALGVWTDEACTTLRPYVCEGVVDVCPGDPTKTAPGQCGCGVPDTDGDSDGTADCNDGCPTDPGKTLPGVCGCGAAESDVNSDGVIDCGSLTLKLSVPAGHSPSSMALSATEELDVLYGAAVRTPGSSMGRVGQLGPVGFFSLLPVEIEGEVGEVWGSGTIELEHHSSVSGSVMSGANVIRHFGSTVSGDVHEQFNVQVDEIVRGVNFVSSSAGVDVLSGSRDLAPGAFGDVRVRLDATLVLEAGTYFFNSLDLDSGGTIVLKNKLASVYIYVLEELDYRGAFVEEAAGADAGNVLVGYFGTSLVNLETPFVGTLVAPRAKIDLEHNTQPHVGAFFAKTIEVSHHASVVHQPFPGWLLPEVTVSNPTPCQNESVLVTAKTQTLAGAVNGPEVESTINGFPGPSRYVQFRAPATYPVHVSATQGNVASGRTIEIQVRDCGAAQEFARVTTSHSLYHPYTVQFYVNNAADLTGMNRRFVWTFGDGTTETTDGPFVAHSYEDSLDPQQTVLDFDASLRLTRDGKPDLVTPKTISLLNTYALSRGRGFAHPPVTVVVPLRKIGRYLSATYRITNVEPDAVEITSQSIERHFCDPDLDPVQLPSESVALSIPGEGSLERDVHLLRTEFGSDTCAITVRLIGHTSGGVEIRASVNLETPQPGFLTVEVSDPQTLDLLNDVASQGLTDPNHITDEELENLFNQGKISFVPPLDDINSGALQDSDDVIGQPCDPEEAPPRDGVYCHATDRWFLTPPLIRNAIKGDLLLVAECGEVGLLLRNVDPRQTYTHEAIMTRNYYALSHSTPDKGRLLDALIAANEDEVGSIFPTNVLRFAWPGAVRASVLEAFKAGTPLTDPEGVGRLILDFDTRSSKCDGDTQLSPPLVVRPAPGAAPSVRAGLHAAADFAHNAETHYRWFGFTRGNISFDGDDNFNSGNFRSLADWSLDQSATVSTVFIWWALKSVGVQLEGSTLEQKANPDGELVPEDDAPEGDGVIDGLYLYKEDERRQATRALRAVTKQKMIDAQEEGGGPLGDVVDLLSAQSDRIADQFINCFVSDTCGEPEKPNPNYPECLEWRMDDGQPVACPRLIPAQDYLNPSIGVAISPAQFLNWDAPLTGGSYGEQENLVFRSTDYRRIHEWKASPGTGSIRARVVLEDGVTRVSNAIITVAGRDERSDTAGEFLFLGIPAGDHEIRARQQITNLEDVQYVTVPDGAEFEVILTLHPEEAIAPPTLEVFPRKVKISGTASITDVEDIGSNETGSFELEGECEVGPTNPDSTVQVVPIRILSNGDDDESIRQGGMCVGQEVFLEVFATCYWAPNAPDNEPVRVDVEATIFEWDAESCPARHEGSGTALDSRTFTSPASMTLAPSVNERAGFAVVELTLTNAAGTTPVVLPNVRPENRRVVTFDGTAFIRDDDWPDPDDTNTYPLVNQCEVDPFDRDDTFHFERCEDEVRVTVDGTCELAREDHGSVIENQSVTVDLDVTVFEGTNCSTTQRAASGSRAFTLAPSGSASTTHSAFTVEDKGSGDATTLDLNITNEQQP